VSRQRRTSTRTVAAAAAALCLLAAGCSSGSSGAGGSSPSATAPTSAAYEKAYRTGLEAYVYGLPLLVTDATYRTMTSVDVPQGAYGPVNRFNNVRTPNTSSSTAVVAPGATSLSSIAWVDLREEPQVLHVPTVTGHYFVLALVDPYTTNITDLGSATATPPGDYVLVDPRHRDVGIPARAHRLDVDYSRIWIIGSTQLLGPDDVATVDRIQDGYTLTPLSHYGTPWTPPTPSNPRTTITKHVPQTGLGFFDQLGEQLADFPPPSADAATIARFAEVGIGAGLTPSTDVTLGADTVRGLTDAVAAGPAQVQTDLASLVASDARTHAGYLLGGFGTYGTDYAERAVISQVGLGAFVPHQAIYAMAWSDATGAALDGSSAYTLHLAAEPPTTEGWSLTLYTLTGALIANPEGRNALTSISPITRNADGSIDLYLSPDQPATAAQQANWLPTQPGEGFEVTWRLFAPEPASIDAILDGSGWQPPAVTPSS
jgi:hypothetical protein